MVGRTLDLRPLGESEADLARNVIAAALSSTLPGADAAEDGELAGLPGSFTRPGGAFWALEAQGAVIGCVGARPAGRPSGVWEICWLALLRKWRGLGLGRMMAESAVAHCREQGAAAILAHGYSSCPAFARLFASLGFQAEATDGPGDGRVAMRMSCQD